MSSIVKSVFKIITFLFLLMTSLTCLCNLLMAGGGLDQERNRLFYSQPCNSVDVLFAGSSHVYSNIDTGYLWDNYGIAAFDMSASSQPIWVTYYRIKNALEYQRPSVVILDAYKIANKGRIYEQNGEEWLEPAAVAWNHFGLPASIDKLQSLIESVPEDELLDYVFEYPIYHSSYSDMKQNLLNRSSGLSIGECSKGTYINFQELTDSYPAIDVRNIEETSELTSKSEKYLIKIIELTQQEGISLLIVNAPYLGISEQDQRRFNAVGAIASEYGVPFLDFNRLIDVLGLNNGGTQTDYADEDHLNYRGARKYTEYLGRYLKDNYQIIDRRGDNTYGSWQNNAEDIRNSIAERK